VRAVKVLLASLRSTLTPAPSAGKRSLARISHEEICRSRKRGKPVRATHQAAATAQQSEPSFYDPKRDSGPPLDSWGRSSTNPSTVDDFAARASGRLASDSPDLHPCAPHHPFAQRRVVTLTDAAREPFVTVTRDEFPNYHARLSAIFVRPKIKPRIVEEHDRFPA